MPTVESVQESSRMQKVSMDEARAWYAQHFTGELPDGEYWLVSDRQYIPTVGSWFLSAETGHGITGLWKVR